MIVCDDIVASLHIEVALFVTHMQIAECASCSSGHNPCFTGYNVMSGNKARKTLRILS